MVKASWGGGGRGMRMVHDPAELLEAVATGRREARAAFGNDEVFLERLVQRAWHIEVQIVADKHGRVVHLHERDCTVQRRHQKVVEIAPSPRLPVGLRERICTAAVRLASEARYQLAGTVEFLVDADTLEFFFIEVNPRVQVEHTVTEVVTGIDIVKAQIRLAQGARIGEPGSGVPDQDGIAVERLGHAVPHHHRGPREPLHPRLRAHQRLPGGHRASASASTAAPPTPSAVITPFYDSLLEKVTAWAPGRTTSPSTAWTGRCASSASAGSRRTCRSSRRSSTTRASARATTRRASSTRRPSCSSSAQRRDRATRLLAFIGDVIVNGNPEVEGQPGPRARRARRASRR